MRPLSDADARLQRARQRDRIEWDAQIAVPAVFEIRGAVRPLRDTFVCSGYFGNYEVLIFCIGVVLLFSKDRGRRPICLDWTRRWGVICSYVVALLSGAQVLFLPALVMASIAAVFHSMMVFWRRHVSSAEGCLERV